MNKGTKILKTVNLTLSIAPGLEGIDSEPSNPLSRALNCLFEEGKPFARFSLCFFTDPDDYSVLRWLGVFAISNKNLISFFPGFNFNSNKLRRYQGQSLVLDQVFNLDHISLEKDLKHWHLTTPKSAKHRSGGLTTPLGSGRYLWFGMSVEHIDSLRKVKTQTVIVAQTPDTDMERRVEILQQTLNKAENLCVSLDPNAQDHFKKGFLHFAFIVGPENFPLYAGKNMAIPIGSSFLSEPLLEDSRPLPVRLHRLTFDVEKIDIQVASMWLPGTITMPAVFTTRFRPYLKEIGEASE